MLVVNWRVVFALSVWVLAVCTSDDLFPILLTLPTFVFVVYKLYKVKGGLFTSRDMYWLCIFFFFIVAPIQSISGYGYSDGPAKYMTYDLGEFVFAEFIVLLGLICSSLFSVSKRLSIFSEIRSIKLSVYGFFVGLIVLSFFCYVYLSGGIANIMLPRLEKVTADVNFVSVFFLGLMAVGVLLLAALHPMSNVFSLRAFCFVFVMILLLVCVNPLNNSRFVIVATWLPICLAIFSRSIGYKIVYAGLLAGLLVVMPLMSVTTRQGVDGLNGFNETGYASNLFKIKDIDIFDTLVHAVRVVDRTGYYYGDNVSAIIFFFVPRSFWPEKPVVGGLVVGGDLYKSYFAGTDNLSFFYVGDLYMDFGVVGVVFGCLFLGFIVSIFRFRFAFVFNGLNVTELILIGSLPILLRGPVGAVIGYFVCLMFSLLVYGFILKMRCVK
ncbi:MAG: hypothetical protein CFE49_00320 [Pseudomonas sp. PGPPP3]|nr:MAG: hypothetical protein CFE49_00320 [Pseudomonas sp. PGPPP3]